MKKHIVMIPVVTLIILILSGCTEKSDEKEDIKTPEDAIRDMYSAADDGDYERWTDYFIYSNGSDNAEGEALKEEQINSMIVQWGRNGELIDVNILSIVRIKEEKINNDYEPFTRYWLSVESELILEGNTSRSEENMSICYLENSKRWIVGSYADDDEKPSPFTTFIDTRLISDEKGTFMKIENLRWNYYHWDQIRILIDGDPIHVMEDGSDQMSWVDGVSVDGEYIGEKETQEFRYLMRSDGSYLDMEIGSIHTVGLERTEDDFLFWEKEITVLENSLR